MLELLRAPNPAAPQTTPMRRWARVLRSAVGARAVILLYHRIGSNENDIHRLAVSPERFEEQMRCLREFGEVLPLELLASRVAHQKLPRRAVAVTFDDGYADNLLLAKPILERCAVPATVFMTTSSIGRQREFWWDELQRIVLDATLPPRTLQFELNGKTHAFEASNDTTRAAAHRGIYDLLWDLQHERRQEILDTLLQQSGLSPTVRPDRRAMSDEEILKLADGGLVDVGAHTHTHPNLAAQTPEVQWQEIVRSKNRLDALLGRPVQSFAYPFGLHTDRTAQIVQEAGFSRACACFGNAVRNTTGIYRLSRADLGDLDGERFARVLREAVGW